MFTFNYSLRCTSIHELIEHALQNVRLIVINTTIIKIFQATDNLILLKLDMADAIDKTVFNIINKTDSTLVLCAILFIVNLFPENYVQTT